VENLFERALICSRHKEDVYCLVKSRTGFLGRSPAAHDIKRHSVRNKLVAFAPYLNCELDVHRFHHITEGVAMPPDGIGTISGPQLLHAQVG
jgi:hypothetical protein